MKLKVAIAMSVISIVMLCIYGADVIVANGNKMGFLPMDVSVRGSIFGIIPSVMLIVSFFITRKEPSKTRYVDNNRRCPDTCRHWNNSCNARWSISRLSGHA